MPTTTPTDLLATLATQQEVPVTPDNYAACVTLVERWRDQMPAERRPHHRGDDDEAYPPARARADLRLLAECRDALDFAPHHTPLDRATFVQLAQAFERAFDQADAQADGGEGALSLATATLPVIARLFVALDAPIRFVGRTRVMLARGAQWRKAANLNEAREYLLAWLREDTRVARALEQRSLVITRHPDYYVDEAGTGASAPHVVVYDDLVWPAGLREMCVSALTRRDARLLHALMEQPELQVVGLAAVTPTSAFYDDPPGLLSTPVGVFDLKAGKRLGEDDEQAAKKAREQHLTRMTAVAPAAVANRDTCPKFLAQLERALPDPAVRDWLQVALGSALTGEALADIALFFLGPPATGKSTTVEAVAAALGAGYVARIEAAAMLASKPNFPYIARLRGKRLALLSEMDKRYRWDAARLKKMTGGGTLPGPSGSLDDTDAQVTPQFLMVVETNEIPLFGTVVGVDRRLRIVRFDEKLAASDITIGYREQIMHDEPAGVLRWLMDGAGRYLNDRSLLAPVTTPPAIQQWTHEVLRQIEQRISPVESFFTALESSKQPLPFSDLYAVLAGRCAQANQATPSKKAVGDRLRARGFTMRRGTGNRMLVGARVADDDDDADAASA